MVNVFALCAALWTVGLDRPFGNGDEVIYAQNVREMARSGSLFPLTWQGAPVLQRPPLPFVLARTSSAIASGERGLRLASAAASFLALMVLYLGAHRLWQRRDVALVAMLLCASCPSFYFFGRALLSDPPFVLLVTVAIVATLASREHPRALIVVGAALGGAVACKSLAAAVPALAIAPWLCASRFSPRLWLAAAAAFLALAAPFYIVGMVHYGTRFWHEHVGYSLVARARGELAVGMPGAFPYLRYLVASDGLAALWVLGGPLAAILCWRRGASSTVAAGCIALTMFALLSLLGTRLPHYLLPVYPASALATAGVYHTLSRDRPPWRHGWRALFAPITAATLLLLGLDRLPEQHFLPSPAAVALDRAARGVPAEASLLVLDWYAPVIGYYADHPIELITSSESFFDILADVDFFRAADAVAMTPPPGTGQVWVAGPAEAIAAAPWLSAIEHLAEAGPYQLVRGQLVR